MFFFFFNDTATTEIYTLSLHDALPICNEDDEGDDLHHHQDGVEGRALAGAEDEQAGDHSNDEDRRKVEDRKSTRLNSSHSQISYAVFCLKKKKNKKIKKKKKNNKLIHN